jgi:hypothetical protein
MCPHCESAAIETLQGMARAGVRGRVYARARRRLRAALAADNEPAVRQWLVEHEKPMARMGDTRSERQAARQAERAGRQTARQGARSARQSERVARQSERSTARTQRVSERVAARGERAEGRAERRETRQAGREERRELRPEGGQLDLSRLEETGTEAVSWLRDQARDLFGGGERTSQTSALEQERERGFPVLPVVLGLAVVGGGIYYATTRKKARK